MNVRLAILAAILAPAPLAAAPPLGQWARDDGAAKVRLYRCGGDICAQNTWVRDAQGAERVGDVLAMRLRRQDDGVMTGTAYDQRRQSSYSMRMTLRGASMTTRGCVLAGLLCKSVSWSRID
jgi:uncharacterized protein (DUF2147 family)